MKNIISFSLWGNNEKYTIGAIENIECQKEFYPNWTCRFYAHKDVPNYIIDRLKQDGAEVVIKEDDIKLTNYSTQDINMGWFWRFDVINDTDVDRFIVRDVDSRLSLREKNCVLDWERTKKSFHLIRDHPHHGVRILAGTWGATSEFARSINYPKLLSTFLDNNKSNNPMHGGYDQFFLSTMIYPLIKNDMCVHDDYHFFSDETVRNVPHIKSKNDFVGKPINI